MIAALLSEVRMEHWILRRTKKRNSLCMTTVIWHLNYRSRILCSMLWRTPRSRIIRRISQQTWTTMSTRNNLSLCEISILRKHHRLHQITPAPRSNLESNLWTWRTALAKLWKYWARLTSVRRFRKTTWSASEVGLLGRGTTTRRTTL